jgi:8-oxo-dGTP pyrophosphatase MutT (NUDIX family)
MGMCHRAGFRRMAVAQLKSAWLTALRTNLPQDPGTHNNEMTQAAVLVPLDVSADVPRVILTQRAQHLRLHAGEIAFPGGKCDPEDDDHWQTALREATEEVDLSPDAVQRLGVLPPLITRTGIQVTPCIGLLSRSQQLRPNPDELDAVFSVPMAFFVDPANLELDAMEYYGGTRRVPRYDYDEYCIWGITAAMLVRLANIGWDAGLELDDYWKGENA